MADAENDKGSDEDKKVKPKSKRRVKKKDTEPDKGSDEDEEVKPKAKRSRVKREGSEDDEEEEEEMLPEEELEEEQEQMAQESVLTVYDLEDFYSGAVNTEDSTIPLDLFEFGYSYGYNCHKYFNLCPCDEAVVCWAAGSIITFMDVNTKQVWFKRSTTGGSVGHICSYRKDPNYRIAVAEGREHDREPIILLYTWPQMEIDAVLRDGTANAYSILDFSPDGELLASVGKYPDYNLTIWNWKMHRILLRTSAFTFDVDAVMFSPYCPGQLTTAGAAHIKFWKMAETFTGLKLQGELGRFGKTEICDVLGVYPMPDEKVLSGCEWGNVLVWEAGLVKLEVTKRGRKACHKAPIIQFMLSPAGDEVTTIARDGCIRVWYWDTVEQADPPEDDPYVELNPVAETCVPDCQIMCLKYQKDMYWYAQDGNGGLWTVELEIDKIECDHRKVLTCHAGGVVALVALRTHPVLVSAGGDGALMAYNTETNALLARYLFPKPITCLYYPPIDVDETSRILMLGFEDGIMRTLFLHPELFEEYTNLIEVRVQSEMTIHNEETADPEIVELISLLKPHSKSLNQITINDPRTLLVTSGQDSTIFMYKLVLGSPFTLQRLCFIQTPNNIAYMTWKPDEERVLLLCGQVGLLMEAVLPDVEVQPYHKITTFKQEFVSYKETLVKKQFMRYRPFPEEEDLASIDEEALKAKDEAEKDDDEEDVWIGEIQLMESESMLGTTITWADYCNEGVWLVQRDTGALLLVKPGNNKILKYGPFPDSWCDDITSLRFICEGRYLVIGTNTGYIRVVRMPSEEEDNPEYHYQIWVKAQMYLLKKLKGRRLAKEEKQPIPRLDFVDRYYLPMHDFYTGAITCLEFSADGKYLYTCGRDGNIFSYAINFSEPFFPSPEVPELELPEVVKVKEHSTVEGDLMSHEQLKQKEEYDKMMAIANAHKKRVRDQLSELTVEYNKLIKANRLLPYSQQIDVILDPRPLEVQEKELAEAMALTIRKLAHQLEASDLGYQKMYSRNIIQLDVYPFTLKAIGDPNKTIRILRQKNLSKAFFDQLDEVYQKMAEAALRGRRTESTARRVGTRKQSIGPPRVASFLLGLPPKPPHPLKKALRNYHQRLNRHHMQFIHWQDHLSHKPDPNAMPPGAADALKEAEATIGNRLLKTQPDYVAPAGHNTQLRVCLTRKEIHDNKHAFNVKVLELRDHKVALIERIKKTNERLSEIKIEIPTRLAHAPPPVPEIDDDLEFPERNLVIRPEPVVITQRGGTLRKSVAPERKRSGSHPQFPQPRTRQPKVPKFVPITETRPLLAYWEILRTRTDMESTPMEIEIRERRIERHLFEQDVLVMEVDDEVKKFDARLVHLQRERIKVQETNQLLELHLYQLHREMNVLNRFEAHEDRLAERVYVKLMQVKGVQDQINDCEHRIEEHFERKDELDLECQELQVKFKKLVQDNKFADFLRRIFKKKYRPPREHDDDESSESEESSSSSEEEDEGSLDSREIGPIRLDPNICPEGCDKEVYDKTYELRDIRHQYEQQMMEEDRFVELLQRDIEAHNKMKRKLNFQLDKRKNNLREFMLEKQSCLNDVETVIILRYDQIRASALNLCAETDGMAKTLIFPEKLLKSLRARVLELQEEIKQQRVRQKVNRTHLFRMNIDLREMERQAEEIRAQMRDVLTRKLGKPRKVDKTLDDLLRQMARRHKFTATLASVPVVMDQVRKWKERYATLEKTYMKKLNSYSDRLRLAAALQADVLPPKRLKDPTIMPGPYAPEQYRRDVIRLRIVRSQQIQQIKALQEEIRGLRLKPLSKIKEPYRHWEPEEEQDELDLLLAPRKYRPRKKYFPITPIGSETNIVGDVNITKLLYDCLDAMRVSREDGGKLMKDLTAELPEVISGAKSRYEVVDRLVKKWLLKHGGDPSQYKKQTKAFDCMAILADRLIKDHMQTMEGVTVDSGTNEVLEQMEAALKDVSGEKEPLKERLGPALAALIISIGPEEVETPLTMASLVTSLVDEEHKLTNEAIDSIDVLQVIADMKDCGVIETDKALISIVEYAVESLRAQLIPPKERANLEADVERALSSESKAELVKKVAEELVARTDKRRATFVDSVKQDKDEDKDAGNN